MWPPSRCHSSSTRNQFRPVLEERLTAALGREVKIGDLKLSIFSGGASASDITVADDPAFSKEPFLRAKDLAVGVELWPLIFSRQLNVTSLTIDQPEIALLQSAAGEWNFSSLGAKLRLLRPPRRPRRARLAQAPPPFR